jgi:hypothetical protein
MRRGWWCFALVAGLVGCGAKDPPPVDDGCRSPGAIVRATGGGGLSIAGCVEGATKDADLQEVGAAVTQAADRLGDDGQARRLGFLIGAVERGAGSSGVQAELVNRVEIVARRLPAGDQRTLRAGIAEGRAGG